MNNVFVLIETLPYPAQKLAREYPLPENLQVKDLEDLFLVLRNKSRNKKERGYWQAMECHIFHDCPRPSISEINKPDFTMLPAKDAIVEAVKYHERPVTVEEITAFLKLYRRITSGHIQNILRRSLTQKRQERLCRYMDIDRGAYVYYMKNNDA